MKRDEELKELLFDPDMTKKMASYVFAQLTGKKQTREFIAQKLCAKAIERGVFNRKEDLDMALEYCDRELFAQFRD